MMPLSQRQKRHTILYNSKGHRIQSRSFNAVKYPDNSISLQIFSNHAEWGKEQKINCGKKKQCVVPIMERTRAECEQRRDEIKVGNKGNDNEQEESGYKLIDSSNTDSPSKDCLPRGGPNSILLKGVEDERLKKTVHQDAFDEFDANNSYSTLSRKRNEIKIKESQHIENLGCHGFVKSRPDPLRMHAYPPTRIDYDDFLLLYLGMDKMSKRKRNIEETPVFIKSQVSEDETLKQEMIKMSCADILYDNDAESDDEWTYATQFSSVDGEDHDDELYFERSRCGLIDDARMAIIEAENQVHKAFGDFGRKLRQGMNVMNYIDMRNVDDDACYDESTYMTQISDDEGEYHVDELYYWRRR